MAASRVKQCRSCKGILGAPVFSLGNQASAGSFAQKELESHVMRAPLELTACRLCGLVQLSHSLPAETMYGSGYGYKSSLNSSMAQHLEEQAVRASEKFQGQRKGIFLDIGSNDGTLLNTVDPEKFRRYGIDPACESMADSYQEGIVTAPLFFSSANFRAICEENADVVTSFAMFYDLESPVTFAKEIAEILADEGTWILEQSYLPRMLQSFSFDTICHEHLNYFTLGSLKFILEEAGLKISRVVVNDINGGSFRLEVKHSENCVEDPLVDAMLEIEGESNFLEEAFWEKWSKDVEAKCSDLRKFLEFCRRENLSVAGIGASTKGNVLLQAAGIDEELLPVIGEVNPGKIGLVTPGSRIPIVSELEALKIGRDFLLILPWHFRRNLTSRFENQMASGVRLVFPLPHLEIVGK